MTNLHGFPSEPRSTPPAESDLRAANRQWKIRFTVMVFLLILAMAGSALTATWWVTQRQANERLLTEGQLTTAEVVSVISARRNSSMTVSLELDDRIHESKIYPGMFESFSQENLGKEIVVLVDPHDPGLVRTQSDRNMHSMTLVAAVGALLALAGATGGVIAARTARQLLRSTQWQNGFVSAEAGELVTPRNTSWRMPRWQKASATLRSTDRSLVIDSVSAVGLGGSGFANTPAKYAESKNFILVVPDGAQLAAILRR